MTENNDNGRQGRDQTGQPDDQSLDRGYGGLPGKQAGDGQDDDTATDEPAKDRDKDKVRPPKAEPRTTH
jgi:hypothetical protein